MPAYYNDNEPYAAAWLRNLIAAGHLPEGDVDDQDIREVSGDDLEGYDQCHFFAGIGGWALALAQAEWPMDRPVWTGSCPCQPLSSAGQRKGHADERHLWPAFQRLIAECAPPVVFGEQVASKDGREWLAGVRADLEHLGYACGAADLPAAGVGAPHIRQRLWWVAYAGCLSRDGLQSIGLAQCSQATANLGNGETHGGLGDAQSDRWAPEGERLAPGYAHWSDALRIGSDAQGWRRVKPGVRLLAHGIPGRLGRLRAYGNAIVPQVAAEFVRAAMECKP